MTMLIIDYAYGFGPGLLCLRPDIQVRGHNLEENLVKISITWTFPANTSLFTHLSLKPIKMFSKRLVKHSCVVSAVCQSL